MRWAPAGFSGPRCLWERAGRPILRCRLRDGRGIEDGDDVELHEALRALRSSWWLPLTCALLGAVAAMVHSLLQTPLYNSSIQMFVSTAQSSSTADAFQGSQLSQQRVASYARLISGEKLASRVVDRLSLATDPSELAESITASAVPETVLLDVTVADPSAVRAEQIASAIGEEFPRLVAELEPVTVGASSPVKVTVSESPQVAAAPTTPQIGRTVLVGAIAGLFAGAGLAVLRRRLDRSVTDPNDIADLAGAPVIATILRDEALERDHVVARAGASRTAEDYRQLRTNLQFLNVDQPPRVIMVSSAVPAEGKTTVVVNLGLALSEAGKRVTIIEADLRKPKVTRYLGIVGGIGLTNVLAGTASADEVVQTVGSGKLRVIAAGPTPPNPGELLSSSHMQSLLSEIREDNDFVLVDSPPLLPVADSTGLAVMMDGVLLSVRYGVTTKDQLKQASERLVRVGALPLGVILNIVPPRADLASAYGYGYSYGYDEAEAGVKGRKSERQAQ